MLRAARQGKLTRLFNLLLNQSVREGALDGGQPIMIGQGKQPALRPRRAFLLFTGLFYASFITRSYIGVSPRLVPSQFTRLSVVNQSFFLSLPLSPTKRFIICLCVYPSYLLHLAASSGQAVIYSIC